jgi:hypothetical protein
MPSDSDPIQLWYYSTDADVLPDALAADRFPWQAVGGGGSLTDLGVLIQAVTTEKQYERAAARPLVSDRIDVQARFQGLTNAPGGPWDAGSGHVLWIDDGERALGLAIGDTLDLIDPLVGTVLYSVPTELLPGGWTMPRSYLFVKDGTARWELHVDGRAVFELPYGLGVASSRAFGAVGWGWLDASGSGSGYWDQIEVGVNTILPPAWLVDRVRETQSPYLRARWTQRNEAVLRAILGLQFGTRDQQGRAGDEFTALVLPISEGSFSGDVDPTTLGWAAFGNGTFSIVRERLSIVAGSTPTGARWDLDSPRAADDDAVYYAAARFTLRLADSADDPHGRLGPFLSVRNGDIQINAILQFLPGNEVDAGWVIDDAALSGNYGNLGTVVMRVPIDGEAFVELYVVGRDRVVLFVDGEIVEDLPYSRFGTVSTGLTDVRIGMDGSATLDGRVEISDAVARCSFGDLAQRPLFLRRVAERLLFAGGTERNDRLDTWMRHRPGVFEARGTSRVLSEIRRIACDDAAELVVNRQPGDWYLDVTYPEVSPVFVEGAGDVPVVYAEHRATAPNFEPAELDALIETYLLPTRAVQSRFYASLVADLTTGTTTTDTTTFDVSSSVGFSVGDLVTLREVDTGTLLSLDYDHADALAADTMDVTSYLGEVWAIWSVTLPGAAAVVVGGALTLTGKTGDRLGLINNGDHVTATSSSSSEDTWIEVFGIVTGPTPSRERIHVVGTTPVTGTTAWAEVHGVIAETPAIGNIALTDHEAPGPLYTIAAAARASGAYQFNPPAFAQPNQLTAVADAATSATFLVAGVERNSVETVASQALNGTTPVVTPKVWSSIRALPMGYVAAARTVTVSGLVLAAPELPFQIVSNNAGDTQIVTLYVINTDLEPEVLTATLTGTTPVSIAPTGRIFHLLGAELATAAVGTVQLTQQAAPTISMIQWTAGQIAKGVTRRRIATTGNVRLRLSGTVTTPRWIFVSGLDADGLPASEVIAATGTDWVRGTVDWSEVRRMATGNLPSTRNVEIQATAWRFHYETHAQTSIPDLYGWTASGPGVVTLDGVLDAGSGDATVGTVDLSGSWSITEDTTIVDIDDTTITTTAIDGSFSSGSRMRLAP